MIERISSPAAWLRTASATPRRGRDDELIGGQHQFGGKAGLAPRGSALAKQPLAAFDFGRDRRVGRDGRNRFPRFGRRDQRDLMACGKVGAEMAGRPERFAVVVAPFAFDGIFAFRHPPAIEHQHARMAEKLHPQRRQTRAPRFR